MRWFIDGNNVMGARADGWWNDPPAAARRLTEQIAEWCRTHDDEVTVIFDRPVDDETRLLAGGNLTVGEARRRGRNAADHDIVERAHAAAGEQGAMDTDHPADGDHMGTAMADITVVTSDRGLIARLPDGVRTIGAGRFLTILDH